MGLAYTPMKKEKVKKKKAKTKKKGTKNVKGR